MMTTNHNYKSNENLNKNYANFIPNNTGQITNRAKKGPYNITEKDFGDHKVVYYIPASYEDNYDLPKLDEEPFYPQEQRHNSPVVRRRRQHHSYDSNDKDYIEELPIISPRRHIYASPRRPQVIKRIYYQPPPPPPPPPPPETIEYIYEDDYRPKNEEFVEYIVQDRVPRQKYIEEIPPIRRTEYVENLPQITRNPTPSSIKPLQLNELPSSRSSKTKQQTTPRKTLSRNNNNEQKHLSLKDIIAGNRARRGSRIPKPRREVDEDEFHDPGPHNKDFIKNDLLIHK